MFPQSELSAVSNLSSEDKNKQDKGNVIVRNKVESQSESENMGMESEIE